MGKIIAVWGTPNSGKTAFTMKLAGHLYVPAAQKRGIGKNIVRRDRGLGKQFTERVNVLTAI